MKDLWVIWRAEKKSSSGLVLWLTYDRKKHTLSQFEIGGGGGMFYTGVTDEMLLRLEKEASQPPVTSISLNRLRLFGCETTIW